MDDDIIKSITNRTAGVPDVQSLQTASPSASFSAGFTPMFIATREQRRKEQLEKEQKQSEYQQQMDLEREKRTMTIGRNLADILNNWQKNISALSPANPATVPFEPGPVDKSALDAVMSGVKQYGSMASSASRDRARIEAANIRAHAMKMIQDSKNGKEFYDKLVKESQALTKSLATMASTNPGGQFDNSIRQTQMQLDYINKLMSESEGWKTNPGQFEANKANPQGWFDAVLGIVGLERKESTPQPAEALDDYLP